MRRPLLISIAAFLMAVAAYPRISKNRINEDCQNNFELGLDSTGGNRSSLNFSSGLKACTDNEKRRWAFEGETLLTRAGTTNQSHKLEGAYDHRFGQGWLAILQASQEADSADGLQARVIVSPGVGYERAPAWGTMRLGAGFGRTWENNRDAGRVSFPQAWSQAVVRWKVQPNITVREKADVFLETKDQKNYWYRSDSNVQFRFGEHFAVETGIVYKWDNKPARNAAKGSWITRTRFVYTWGEKR